MPPQLAGVHGINYMISLYLMMLGIHMEKHEKMSILHIKYFVRLINFIIFPNVCISITKEITA